MKYIGLGILFAAAVGVAAPAAADSEDRYTTDDGYRDVAYHTDRKHHARKHHRKYKKYRKHRHYRRHYRSRDYYHRNRGYHRDRYYYDYHYYTPRRHYYQRRHHYRHHRRHCDNYYCVHYYGYGDYYKWLAGAVVATELIHHTLAADTDEYEPHYPGEYSEYRDDDHEARYRDFYSRTYSSN